MDSLVQNYVQKTPATNVPNEPYDSDKDNKLIEDGYATYKIDCHVKSIVN